MSSRAFDRYPPTNRWPALRWAAPVAIALAAIASFTWQALELRDWLTQPAFAPAPVAIPERHSVDMNPAMDRLFGAKSEAARNEQRLRLRASFVHSDPSRSSALIIVDNDRPRRLLQGDEVMPGMRLSAIHHDHVQLAHAGQLQSVWLRRVPGEQRP